ncbi:hypothetical protein EG329_001316 [Mollisiaceae sp. DMI_Dod_QoI]|nr:hypothetical protein EG329_001316 [Helotiales sp. DMI_Dod_QoI]
MSGVDSRKDWDDYELELAGAINTGPLTRRPDLTNPVHKLFEREKWTNISDDEYNILLPSLRLASNLIAVGTDYFAQFLPSDDVHEELAQRLENKQEHVIIFKKDPFTDEELQTTREELDSIAEDIEWRLNYTLAKTNGALGMTRHVKEGYYAQEPWPVLTLDEVVRSDHEAQQNGHPNRRPLLVGIMAEYMQALKDYTQDSEAYLRAIFHAAITITHEVGHVVWLQDYRDLDYDEMGREPFVENYSMAELGFCWEAFLFSGFHVRTAKIKAETALEFEAAAIWDPYLTTDVTMRNRPLYRTQFSIPIAYMQQLFTQKFWDDLGDQAAYDFSAKAVAALKPATDLNAIIPPATARARNWTMTRYDEKPRWEREFFDRGETPNISGRISKAEIELVKEELRPYFKQILPTGKNPFGEDDDEDFDEFDDPTPPISESLSQVPGTLSMPKDTDDGVVKLDYDDVDRGDDENSRGRKDPNGFKSSKEPLSPELTRADVRYLPPGTANLVSSKRARSPDDMDDNSIPKRRKLASDMLTIEATAIDDVLKSISPQEFEQCTREEARYFCTARNIDPGPLAPDEAFQRGKLSVDNELDRHLIERMRCHQFREAEERFVDDPVALVKIKQARLVSFEYWHLEDVKDLCIIQGQPVFGQEERIRDRARNWLRMDLADAKSRLPPGDPVPPEPVKDYDTWSRADFNAFFRANNLPEWGDDSVVALRLQRFRDEQSTGKPPDRKLINQHRNGKLNRTDINGVEHYSFDIVLARTTVMALKGHLFNIAMIPASHDINLYFGTDRDSPLENHRPLSDYGKQRDWRDLTMITEPLKQATPEPEPPKIPVYIPKTGNGTGHGHSGSGSRGSGSSRSGNNNKSPPHIDPSLKRSYDIRHGAEPTFRERMHEISRRGSDLEKVITAGGGADPLRPHLQSVIASTPSEMLDTLDDIEEQKQEREERVDEIVENHGKGPATSNSTGGPFDPTAGGEDSVPEEAPEHMADMFKRLKKKEF